MRCNEMVLNCRLIDSVVTLNINSILILQISKLIFDEIAEISEALYEQFHHVSYYYHYYQSV